MPHEFRHQTETDHVVTHFRELRQVASGIDSAIDQSSRGRAETLHLSLDSLAFGNVPSVIVCARHWLLKMTGVPVDDSAGCS